MWDKQRKGVNGDKRGDTGGPRPFLKQNETQIPGCEIITYELLYKVVCERK